MQVTFFIFNKDKNELRVPTGGTTKEVTLKQPCSVLNPVIVLQSASTSWNYFYIPEFSRYYFIEDIRYIHNNTVEITGTVDAMGSHRDGILNTSQYILRAASGYDVNIPDLTFPAKGGRKLLYAGLPVTDITQDYKQGGFVIGAIGENAGYAGIPVVYYYLDYAQMMLFNDYLFNQDNYASLISDDVVKAFFNPMDYIISCIYFPYPLTAASWEDTDIYFGWFKTTGIFAKKLPNYWYTDTGLNYTLNIPKPYSDYRLLNPWTQYRLWCIDQWIDIPPEKLYNYSQMGISIQLDLVAGNANVNITVKNSGDSAYTVARTACQFGCPISMAQLRQDWQGTISNAVGAIGSLFTLDIGKTVNGVMDAVNSFLPDPATKGSNGALGSAFWQKYVELYCYYCETAPIDEGRLGRPVAKRDTVSNYEGFCQCRNAEVTITGAYSSEIDTIENYMNGGFYVN